MSYSFDAKAINKTALLAAATSKLDAIIATQPVHAQDREAALANVRAHLALVDEPAAGQELVVSMHGSICVNYPTAGPISVTSAGSGCNIWLQTATAHAPHHSV